MSRRTFLPRTTRVIVFIIRPLLMLLTKRDWKGAEKLPQTGGYVLAPNHISHLDPFTISHFMVDHGVTPRFLAKDTLMTAPVVGAILRSAEQIPVRRRTANAKDSLGPAEAAVREGKVVTIYPEGTITRDPAAWPMTGYTGAVRVALSTGAPLVPVMQWGPEAILWPYTKRPRLLPRKTIHIRVSDPLDLSDLEGQELTDTLLRAATDRLMDTLTAMMADVRGELPSTPRIDAHTIGKHGSTKPAVEVSGPRPDNDEREQ
ncbi:lysophospholipid acyltransferase family protein [Aeromicrobium sp.]|uniref:lysophospholipid acyltransferase family protein n=1 Tax=Aeromicrobium sp. TaxID=1871063 RepID=UPI003C6A5FA7